MEPVDQIQKPYLEASMTMEIRPRNLVLILARDLADKLASAAFIVDEEGSLVYFNERCGEILGMPYSEAGEMRMADWSRVFAASDAQGGHLQPDELPLVQALRKQSPQHRKLRVRGADDQVRLVAVTAVPLFAHEDECVGAMALFWEHAENDGEP
jgi:hypothetical protein